MKFCCCPFLRSSPYPFLLFPTHSFPSSVFLSLHPSACLFVQPQSIFYLHSLTPTYPHSPHPPLLFPVRPPLLTRVRAPKGAVTETEFAIMSVLKMINNQQVESGLGEYTTHPNYPSVVMYNANRLVGWSVGWYCAWFVSPDLT
jgi:hypothetical protein